MMSREVVVVSGVRTAIGTYGGSLKDIPPPNWPPRWCVRRSARAKVRRQGRGPVVFGHVVNTEPKDMYLSRVAAINGGCAEGRRPSTSTACAARACRPSCRPARASCWATADIAIGGGAENMSRAPLRLPNMRWGARMGDTKMVDMVVGALHDPFHNIHMGVTAENMAAQYGITPRGQDELAVESHSRAQRATEAGYFKEPDRSRACSRAARATWFSTPTSTVRPDGTLEDMAKLKPAFKEDGTVTAGNASGMNDAAAAVVLMEARRRQGARPEAAGAAGGLRPCRRGPEVHGHRPGAGDAGWRWRGRA